MNPTRKRNARMKQLKGWKLYVVMVAFWLPVMFGMMWLWGRRGSYSLSTEGIAIIALVATTCLILWTFIDRNK